jgi:hypothetical protein
MTWFEVPLFGFICTAAWVSVCYCVVPKYIGIVIVYAPLTVGFYSTCVVVLFIVLYT